MLTRKFSSIIFSSKLQNSAFSTCRVWYYDGEWRKRNGLSENPNAMGPLTDLPDFTYLDGRPTPPGKNLVKRRLKHRELAQQVIELSRQMDEIDERNRQKLVAAEKQKLLEERSSLKPKGNVTKR